ncbi:uncharacterized protein ACRADG_013102 [Cochliomyia hominivorax]
MKFHLFITIIAVAFSLQEIQAKAVDYNEGYQPDNNIDFGTALKMYYTAFQSIMPCGYPPLHIPVLAPFSMDFFAFNKSNESYNVAGNASDIVITGLNNFRVLSGSFNSTTNRTTFNIIFPEVQSLGKFAIDAMASISNHI